MLTEYEQYVLGNGGLDMDGGVVCSSSTGPGGQPDGGQRPDADADVDAGFLGHHGAADAAGWQHHAGDDGYTLTELSDASQEQDAVHYPRDPLALLPTLPWGAEPWQRHGPAHAGNPFEDDAGAVSASDGDRDAGSPDRRCVRSLLHVALHRGGSFAQQFTSCGVPPLEQPPQLQQLQPPPYYPGAIKQEPGQLTQPLQPVPRYAAAVKSEPGSLAPPLASPSMYVSSTSCPSSCSPRPVTPADSLRSCYSPASPYPHPHLLPPMQAMQQCGDDAVVSTTSPCFSLPPPCYGLSGMPGLPAFRPPYPTPSPDPRDSRPELSPYHGPLAPLVPLPVHLLNGAGPTTPPATPPSRSAKRRRNRPATTGLPGATPAPRKRERSERQLHPCSLCEKRFKDNYSVNVHMRTHTGEKPFPCIVCGKMFRQKAHLAKHRSTHQASEWAAAAAAHLPASSQSDGVAGSPGVPLSIGVDGNSNSLPLWPESKCKAPNIWTPVIMPSSLSSVQ